MPAFQAGRLPAYSAVAFAALTLAVTATAVVRAAVNVPFWDDFDSYLGFLLHLDGAAGLVEKLRMAVAFHNEHRTLTSRLAVALVHVLGGTLDFRLLAWAGAAMFVPLVALACLPVREPRSRPAALVFSAAFLFNLQHWENLFWGGSSVDHVTVVVLALGSLLLLRKTGAWWLAAAGATACAASFTLAHGLIVFPAGLVVLLTERRWRDSTAWGVTAAVVAVVWSIGFPRGSGLDHVQLSLPGFLDISKFWLGMLGAPVAFGQRWIAPWIGAGIVAAVVVAWRMRLLASLPYQASIIWFLLGATAAIAFGRAGIGPTDFMVSRYRVLACLLYALLAWLLHRALERILWRAAFRFALLVATAGLWAEQTQNHWWRADAFRIERQTAAAHYAAYSTLDGAPFRLYYDPPKADQLLLETRAKGIFELRP